MASAPMRQGPHVLRSWQRAELRHRPGKAEPPTNGGTVLNAQAKEVLIEVLSIPRELCLRSGVALQSSGLLNLHKPSL